MEPMRSGRGGDSRRSIPPPHVSAFLPGHISFSTNWGKHLIAHKGAQAFPELSVGGKSSSCQLPFHFIDIKAAPDTHITSQMARPP